MKPQECAILILNWNGASWLQKCLPSIVAAAQVADADVWVVDNASSDDSEKICREQFSAVRWEPTGGNLILAGYNVAAARCLSPTILFLNNDVVVDENFLPPLLKRLKETPDSFSVAPCVRTFPPGEGSPIEHGVEKAYWKFGAIRGIEEFPQTASYTRFTLGGAMLCWREKFLELGGFDDLYLPGYVEDVDLCWRAWKRGWVCVYEPASTVYHAGGASFGRSDKVKVLTIRNDYFFHWKNITTPSFRRTLALTELPRLLGAVVKRDKFRLEGFKQASAMRAQVEASREKALPLFHLGDEEVIQRISGSLEGR